MQQPPLTRRVNSQPGIDRYALDLAMLYTPQQLEAFRYRWHAFLDATGDDGAIFQEERDTIIYETESFLPPADGRARVLLILGNPACQSVRAGMCFAHERGGAEHRFWRALRATAWLDFHDEYRDGAHRSRRDALLSGAYDSPFSIGIDVFHTFPSPASAPIWSGVSGLAKLFGASGLQTIAALERERLAQLIPRFDAVITFQRDAYEALRNPGDCAYSGERARRGELVGTAVGRPLLCAPPTRLAHTTAFRTVLQHQRELLITRQSRVT